MAATDQAISGVPGRYAQALYELALEQNAVDKVQGNLAAFQVLVAESVDLQRLIASPIFTAEDQASSLEAVLAKAKISGIAGNFILLMAKNRRLPALMVAIAAYHALVAEDRGEVLADVTSAEALSAAQLAKLKSTLTQSMGKDVKITTRVDRSILGGLIVRVGSKMLDNSLKTKLQNLKVAMKGTG